MKKTMLVVIMTFIILMASSCSKDNSHDKGRFYWSSEDTQIDEKDFFAVKDFLEEKKLNYDQVITLLGKDASGGRGIDTFMNSYFSGYTGNKDKSKTLLYWRKVTYEDRLITIELNAWLVILFDPAGKYIDCIIDYYPGGSKRKGWNRN